MGTHLSAGRAVSRKTTWVFVTLGLIAELIVAGHSPEMEYRVRHRV